DDVEDNRRIYAMFLQFEGFEVTTAVDGHDALNQARAHPPDLVVMDLAIPGIDGWEVTRTLKRDGRTRAIPVIAVSGQALAVAEGCAIVITDLVLPQMDGIELLQQLKEMARPPVILILTAHGTVTTAVEAMRQGAFYYLTKPVDPVQLQVLLEKSLEQASPTRELSPLRPQLKQQAPFGKL